MFDLVVDADAEGYDIKATVEGGLIRWQFAKPSVSQRVQQAIKLMQGTWFLDTREGLPWQDLTLSGNKARIDANIRRKINSVRGVNGVISYQSTQRFGVLEIDVVIASDLGEERVFFELEG